MGVAGVCLRIDPKNDKKTLREREKIFWDVVVVVVVVVLLLFTVFVARW
jgi:hypothetical protein